MQGRSCITQLLEWTSILDNGGYIDIIYMDYAKAFNKVAHERLVRKLGGYGIGGSILNWIHSFLTGIEEDRKWLCMGRSLRGQTCFQESPRGVYSVPYSLSFI